MKHPMTVGYTLLMNAIGMEYSSVDRTGVMKVVADKDNMNSLKERLLPRQALMEILGNTEERVETIRAQFHLVE